MARKKKQLTAAIPALSDASLYPTDSRRPLDAALISLREYISENVPYGWHPRYEFRPSEGDQSASLEITFDLRPAVLLKSGKVKIADSGRFDWHLEPTSEVPVDKQIEIILAEAHEIEAIFDKPRQERDRAEILAFALANK